ncbi:nuclear transport factor 2 family protein [Streptomyces zhihengii]
MNSHDDTSTALWGPVDLVTAAGIDHVRLVYDYLDAGDRDGCASLLHDGVVFELPGLAPAHGRAAALEAQLRHTVPAARHEIDRVVAQDRNVVAAGGGSSPAARDRGSASSTSSPSPTTAW